MRTWRHEASLVTNDRDQLLHRRACHVCGDRGPGAYPVREVEVVPAEQLRGADDALKMRFVAGMRDSEDEAIERLEGIEAAMRDYRKTLNYRKDRLAIKTADGVLAIGPRLRSMIGQVRDRRSAA
jgi:hypothetical protein